jgi:GTP cyclohydrolase I
MSNSIFSMANENVSGSETEQAPAAREKAIAHHVGEILRHLNIAYQADPNTKDTPKRIAKMYCREIFAGRFEPCPEVSLFPAPSNAPYMVGPLGFHSTCSHHFQPVTGQAWVALFPGEQVMGLSKFSRLLDWVARRPQIQEGLTAQWADLLMAKSGAEALAVKIVATHGCMTCRGVMDHGAQMTTYALRGSKSLCDQLRTLLP